MNSRRYVSILGDSVSTFSGYNPPGFSVYYSEEIQKKNGIAGVSGTWWYKVLEAMNAQLAVNNSYSGSRVSGDVFPAANTEERLRLLRTETVVPQLVLIYIGGNDFGYNVPLESGRRLHRDASFFGDAYDMMLRRIHKLYPQTEIICATGMRTYIHNKQEWQFPEFLHGVPKEAYNDQIRKCCRRHKVHLADLSRTYIRYETLDGSHPTAMGHYQIATAWISELARNGWLVTGI